MQAREDPGPGPARPEHKGDKTVHSSSVSTSPSITGQNVGFQGLKHGLGDNFGKTPRNDKQLCEVCRVKSLTKGPPDHSAVIKSRTQSCLSALQSLTCKMERMVGITIPSKNTGPNKTLTRNS